MQCKAARGEGRRWHAGVRPPGRLQYVLATLALVLVRGQDSTMRCLQHSDCGAARQFCAVQTCSTWEGFEFPCGICGPCSLCKCHRDSIDGVCPASCPYPAGEVVSLQGMFANRDLSETRNGSSCLRLWTFEGMRFRRHDTGLTHAEAYRSLYYLNPTASREGSRLTLKPAWDSPCKPSTKTGHFAFEESASGEHGSFVLSLSTPIYDTVGDVTTPDFASYTVEKASARRVCPGGLELQFADGSVDILEISSRSTIFPRDSGEEIPRYAGLFDRHIYSGKISLHDTMCSVFMEFSPAGASGLVYFTAITQECEIGSILAPGMPEPDVAREKKLRRSSVFDHRREEVIRPAIALTRLHTMSIQVNLSHYDWALGHAVNMELCQRQLGTSNTTYTTSRGCYPFPNNTHSRCVQYPLKDHVLSSLKGTGSDGITWTNKWVETYKYDCRCEIGYYDDGCAQSGHPGSMRCGNASMSGWNATAETGWSTTKELYQDSDCECGVFCIDIDECVVGTHNCHTESACINTNGSFTCSCNLGFSGPGTWCEDVRECMNGRHNCAEHATCFETYGSFTCACNKGLSGDGTQCTHYSKVTFERVWPLAIDLEWSIEWHIQTPPHVEDIVSVYRVQGSLYQLVGFFFASAAPCSTASSCVGECVMPCHEPGTLESKDDWRWASQLFRTISLGEGLYRAVLFSMEITEIVAVHDFNVTRDSIEVKEPYTDRKLVPPGFGRPVVGGLLGCQGLEVGSKCCQGINWTHSSASCITIPDPVQVVEKAETVVVIPQRCGDGRLELGDSALMQEPLKIAGQGMGRVEECDDGNDLDGDGCDGACRIEAETNCSYHHNTNMSQIGVVLSLGVEVPRFQMGRNPLHRGLAAESVCIIRFCGDGKRNVDGEECDDGQTSNHPRFLDGCRDCKVDLGWKCITRYTTQTRPDLTTYEVFEELCTSFAVPVAGHALLDTSMCPGCTELQECVYFEYEYQCKCKTGYARTVAYGNGYVFNSPFIPSLGQSVDCIDLDECRFAEIANPVSTVPGASCDESAHCTNTVGGVECTCPPKGYNGTGYFGSPCVDIDECASSEACHRDGECRNVPGSYLCLCNPGFRGKANASAPSGSLDGCVDIDECADGSDTCRATQTCLNQIGTYFCRCNDGMLAHKGECFPPAYWQRNQPFLNRMGWYGPKAVQGLIRIMDAEDFARFASAGFGWWMFLDGSLQTHHMLYSLGAVAPTYGNPDEWDPIQCDSGAASVVLEERSGWIKESEHAFLQQVNRIFVLDPSVDTARNEVHVIHIKFHSLRLDRNDAIIICYDGEEQQQTCTKKSHIDVPDLMETGLKVPAIAATLRLEMGGLEEPLFDPNKCSDAPGWAGMRFLGSGTCADITYAFAEKTCVPENKDASGVSALDACCVCGGGSKGQAASREFSIGSSYAQRRYKMAASYFVEQVVKGSNASDVFFIQQAEEFEREAAQHGQQRPLKHKLSVANGIDPLLGFPKCLDKSRMTDYGSTITLEKGTTDGEPMLHGLWRGTCKPSITGRGDKTCNVNLLVRRNTFEWSIDGCFGFEVDRFATGIFRPVHDDVRTVADQFTNVVSLKYKLIDVLYSSGAPTIVPDGSKVARGVFGWRDTSLDAPQDEIIISVNRPGDQFYPGRYTSGDFRAQMFPCQLAELHRVHENSMMVPVPAALPATQSRIFLTAFELYQACNNSISTVQSQSTVCNRVLEGLMGTRVPLDGFSEDQLISAEEACSHSCFAPFNSSLHTAIDICRNTRVRFHAIARNERRLDALDTYFLGRLIFLAETRIRVESTCTTNYMKKSCRSVMGMIKSSSETGCMATRTVIDAGLPIGADATLDFAMKPSSQFPGRCTPECKQMFSSIAQESHCCAASYYEAQLLWMDVVGPGQRQVAIDLRAYRCLYQENFDCDGSAPEPLTLSRDHLPTLTRENYPERIRSDGSEECKFFSKQDIKCGFELCDPDRLADGVTPPVLQWPKPCCLGLQCLNEGTLPFSGSCLCLCPAPFVRADCSEAMQHLSFALALEGAEYHRFLPESALGILSAKMGILPGQLELSFINAVEASQRRHDAALSKHGGTVDWQTHISKAPGRQYRRVAATGLEIGVRIIIDSERELLRVQKILETAIAKGELRQPFVEQGLGAATGFSQKPLLVRTADSVAAVVGMNGTVGAAGSVQDEDSASLASIPLTLIIAIVAGLFGAMGCAFALRRLMNADVFAEAMLRVTESRDAHERERRLQRYSTSIERYESRYDNTRGNAQELGIRTVISKGATLGKRTLAQAASEEAATNLKRGPFHGVQVQHLSAKHHDEETRQPPSEGENGEGQTHTPEKRTLGSIKSLASLASPRDTEQKLAPENALSRGRTMSAHPAIGQNHVKLLDLETKTTNLQKIVRQQQLRSGAASPLVDMRISGGEAGLAISGSPSMIKVSLGSQGVARSVGRRGVPASAPEAGDMYEAASSASDEVDALAPVVPLWNQATPRLDRPWLEELRRKDAQAMQAGLPSRVDSASARKFVRPNLKKGQQTSFLTAGMSLKELRRGSAGQRPTVRPVSDTDYGNTEGNAGRGAGRRRFEDNGDRGMQVGVAGGDIVSATIGHLSEAGAEENDGNQVLISLDTARSSVSFNAITARLSVH